MSVSVRDVAALAGVSVGTVSNVLNRPQKVAPSTVAQVTAAIESLGFVRNEAARQLRSGGSHSVGLIVSDMRDSSFAELAGGAEDRASDASLAVLLGNSDASAEREQGYLDLFLEQRVRGVLVSPVDADLARLAKLRAAATRVVLIESPSSDHNFSSVAVDHVAGGRVAVEHLLSLGRRRIAFVGGTASDWRVAARLAGAQAAVAAVYGASLEVIDTPALTVLSGREAGEMLGNRQAYARPDAVFAANDLLALGVLQAFTMMGELRVPHDIALIGYDDIEFAASAVTPLSSIRQPSALLGSTAVELLLAETAGDDSAPQQIMLQPELIVRASTTL